MTGRKSHRSRTRVLRPAAPFRRTRLAVPPHEAKVLAAGGVVWRSSNGTARPRRSDDVEIAVVHRPKYDDWSLPKGKVDPGEQMVVAAVREVVEETGFSAACGRVVGDQRYTVAAGPKFVRYWAMHDVDGHVRGAGRGRRPAVAAARGGGGAAGLPARPRPAQLVRRPAAGHDHAAARPARPRGEQEALEGRRPAASARPDR